MLYEVITVFQKLQVGLGQGQQGEIHHMRRRAGAPAVQLFRQLRQDGRGVHDGGIPGGAHQLLTAVGAGRAPGKYRHVADLDQVTRDTSVGVQVEGAPDPGSYNFV